MRQVSERSVNRRASNVNLRDKKLVAYEKFLEPFFLRASAKSDYLPADPDNGPLPSLYKTLFAPSYRVGPRIFADVTRKYYFSQDNILRQNKTSDNLNKIYVFNLDSHKKRQMRVYEYRRLPVSFRDRQEMEPVRVFLI